MPRGDIELCVQKQNMLHRCVSKHTSLDPIISIYLTIDRSGTKSSSSSSSSLKTHFICIRNRFAARSKKKRQHKFMCRFIAINALSASSPSRCTQRAITQYHQHKMQLKEMDIEKKSHWREEKICAASVPHCEGYGKPTLPHYLPEDGERVFFRVLHTERTPSDPKDVFIKCELLASTHSGSAYICVFV